MKSSDFVPVPDVGANGPYFLIGSPRRGFSNHSNYVPPVTVTVYSPSRTVPDMSPTLRSMLNRATNGGALKTFQGVNVPIGSRIPINLELMDNFQKAELAEQNADFIATTRGQMQTARAARIQADLLEKATAAAEARIIARNSVVTGDRSSDSQT